MEPRVPQRVESALLAVLAPKAPSQELAAPVKRRKAGAAKSRPFIVLPRINRLFGRLFRRVSSSTRARSFLTSCKMRMSSSVLGSTSVFGLSR
jgi:hypothetical protein